MTLPIKFSGVHYYRIAGKYIFIGDLFIARNTLYYFPEADMAEQREEITRHMPHELALLIAAGLYLGQRLGGSYLSRTEFWREGLSDETFQNQAAAYVEWLRFQRQSRPFTETLPLPTHVRSNEISDIKLSATGRLSFIAQSDNHDFNIGVFRKKRLRDALWEAGVGRVGFNIRQ